MKAVFFAIGLSLLSGCATYAVPNYVNGNYYMGGDPSCRQFKPMSATRIMCMDKDGNETGYRDPMTPEQMQMYQMQQQQQQQIQIPSTVSCRKFGDLSGQIYQFASSICPYGYY